MSRRVLAVLSAAGVLVAPVGLLFASTVAHLFALQAAQLVALGVALVTLP